MSEHVIDTVLRVRVEHRPGQFARLASTIADAGGLIGDISTIRVGETATLRDVTIETIGEDQTRRVVECVGAIDGVDVVETTDRVFEAHRGVLYDELVDISATPILVDTLDPAEFVDTVVRISHTFGGIMATADIVIAATGRPDLIEPRDPKPEISPSDARAAGAAFAGDGRSINNALAFPGLFRGALEVRSSAITTEMLIAAAETIASLAEPGEVVPSCLDRGVHQAVARTVAETARTMGLAGTAKL